METGLVLWGIRVIRVIRVTGPRAATSVASMSGHFANRSHASEKQTPRSTQYKEQRTCLEDALFHCLLALGVHTSPQAVRSHMGEHPFHVAQEGEESVRFEFSACFVELSIEGRSRTCSFTASVWFVRRSAFSHDQKNQKTTVFSTMEWRLSITKERQKVLQIEEGDLQPAAAARAVFQVNHSLDISVVMYACDVGT